MRFAYKLHAENEINMYQALTKENFQKEVIESNNISVVKFKVNWSGACQILEPVYNDLSNAYRGMVNFFTVDVEKEKGLDDLYGVMELPTILFFKSGKLIDHVVGLTPKNNLILKLENAINTFN
jgi:thioredoxin 1